MDGNRRVRVGESALMNELIQRIRDHYVEQFKAFVALQRQELQAGTGEVKLQLNIGEGIFRGLYCVDFLAKINGEMAVREMQPDRVLTFEPFHATLGQALFEVSNLRWDDLIVEHDLDVDVMALEDWFDAWFDPEDKRYAAGAEVSRCIHSLSVHPGKITADLGTAPPDTLWHLMKVLLDAGATHIRISCTEGR